MDWRTVQIGAATQIGIILLIVGLVCIFKPYETAKWHANDEDVERREYKRQQSHRRNKNGEYSRDPNRREKEPMPLSVLLVRLLGGVVGGIGAAMIFWSFT